MKTYEQAFAAVVTLREGAQSRESIAAMNAEATDRCNRFRGIVDEIESHSPMQLLLQGIADADFDPLTKMYAAMQIGLRIGIEMERNEVFEGITA